MLCFLIIFFCISGLCTPYVTDFLKVEHKKASACKVTRSTNGMYEVKLSSCTYRVSLERRTCTCMKFEICGIPCEHAYGVMLQKKLAPENYVCQWFHTATWRRNYRDGLVPVRGADFWPKTSAPDVHIPPEPPQPARKKITKADKKRKRGVNESPTKKAPKNKKRTMHCGTCGEPNHNSRFHKKQQVCSVLILDITFVNRLLFFVTNVTSIFAGFSRSSSSSFSSCFSSCISDCFSSCFT